MERWIKLSKTLKTHKGQNDLFLREQFIVYKSKELLLFLLNSAIRVWNGNLQKLGLHVILRNMQVLKRNFRLPYRKYGDNRTVFHHNARGRGPSAAKLIFTDETDTDSIYHGKEKIGKDN